VLNVYLKVHLKIRQSFLCCRSSKVASMHCWCF